MAIIRFGFDKQADGLQSYPREPWPEGAYCVLGSDSTPERIAEYGALVLWETHTGLCIADSEMNGYDDSDFYMLVWDPVAVRAERILFATTRGWSYPSYGSKPDATSETLVAYSAWCEEQKALACKAERLNRAKELRAQRQKHRSLSERMDVPFLRLQKLTLREPRSRADAAVHLLGQQQLRNKVRISIREQLIQWLKNPSPQHPSPLSYKQWSFI